jgi:pimeloyl-ACP methyl ester carboxylesterase
MGFMFKDELTDMQWLRTVGHAAYGGADVAECIVVGRAIRELDAEGWYANWRGLAERTATAAQGAAAAGHLVSAREAWFRASNYFRAAYCFLIGLPVDPRVVECYRRQRDAFAAGAALLVLPPTHIEIPCEGTALRGLFFPAAADPSPRPTLIITGGYDSTFEETYFFSGAAALARGYNVMLFDGPGQGGAIVEQGLVFRPDWESVVTPAVDWAVAEPRVDADAIALMGISFGGYLAPRAASAEPRLAALIADPGQYALFDSIAARLPAPFARALREGGPGWMLRLLETMLDRRLRHPTQGWALRRGLWVHGVTTVVDYIELTRAYTLEGRVTNICCPTFVSHAEKDAIAAQAPKLFEALRCSKTFAAFTAAEGAGAHCESGERTLFNQRAFDWLDKTLRVQQLNIAAAA